MISAETRKKMIATRKKNNSYKHSEETKIKIGLANKGKISKLRGRKISEEVRRKISKSHIGMHHSVETRLKMKERCGEKGPRWKGGITSNKEYVSWLKNKRNRIIKRLKIDGLTHSFGEWELLKKQYGNTCPCCHKSEPEIKLTEDHIIPLSKGGSDLIENIQPLCLKCNIKKHILIIKY
jgi:5-methylcytosine-specific restriction endonuclease McrA